MAYSPDEYTGNGSTTLYTITFPYLDVEDVKVTLNGAATTAFTVVGGGTQVQFNTAPGSGVAIKIYRETPVDAPEATFYTGASVRAVDLNENFLQNLYYAEETREVANEATTGAIPDGSIGTAKLATSAVTTDKINDNAVTAAKLANDSVDTAAIQAGAVTNAKLGTNSVATANIQDNAIVNSKLGDQCVNTAELADSSVTQAKIGTNVLTPTVSQINGGPLAGFRNAVINGNFDIWQRGISSASGGYLADRWFNVIVGSSCTTSRQAFTLGQTDVPGEPTYFQRAVVTSVAGASNLVRTQTSLEGVRSYAGAQITVSFWAKADASRSISISFTQYFGTGGSPSATILGIGAVKKSVTTTWQKITHTLTVPSISGKTIGTDGNDTLRMFIWFDAGSSYNSETASLGQQSGTFDIAEVQIEGGPVATPFEVRPLAVELGLCQRYYETATGNRSLFSGNVTSGSGYQANTAFKVDKRDSPTVTLTNISAVSFPATVGTVTAGRGGFAEARTANATGPAVFISGWTADAEL